MKLQILKTEALDDLKDVKFIDTYLHQFQSSDAEWIKDVLGYDPFIETKYELPQLNLKYVKGNQKLTAECASQNVREVYSKLKFLSDSDASQERLWTALCFGPGWKYTQARWNKSLSSAKGIQDHWFFNFGGKRNLTRNAISRLWWIGRLTYDPIRESNGEDPFELTDLVCSAQDIIFHVIERNISNNLIVIRPFLEAILECRREGEEVNTDDVGELSKYLNTLGGTYILDFAGEEWIKNKIKTKIISINTRKAMRREKEKVKVTKKSILKIKIIKNGRTINVPVSALQRTRPTSLIGMSVGASFIMNKQKVEILGIKN